MHLDHRGAGEGWCLPLSLTGPGPNNGPDIAWIAADDALNHVLNDRFRPEIPKTSLPTR
jgi:hypothetical protein